MQEVGLSCHPLLLLKCLVPFVGQIQKSSFAVVQLSQLEADIEQLLGMVDLLKTYNTETAVEEMSELDARIRTKSRRSSVSPYCSALLLLRLQLMLKQKFTYIAFSLQYKTHALPPHILYSFTTFGCGRFGC